MFITPRTCARGKVIGRIVVVVSTNIAISRGLTRKHDELVAFDEKRASECFESKVMVHDCHK